MNNERVNELLRKGEGLTIEFKRCAGRIEHDVFCWGLVYGIFTSMPKHNGSNRKGRWVVLV